MSTNRPGLDHLKAEAAGLRGTIKICEEEDCYPAATGTVGAAFNETVRFTRFEFDSEGRLVSRTFRNADGAEWETHYSYSPAGLLLKTTSGMKGGIFSEVVNEYDASDRIQKTVSSAKSLEAAAYSYDDRLRKKKTQVSRPEDYRSNLAFGGSPFAANDHAPNLPGGGTATTFYDEQDRPCEIEVRDETGELVTRVARTYDEKGNIAEEIESLPDPVVLLPRQSRERMLQESGASVQDLREQLTKLMAGHSGPHSVKYVYDAQGRLVKTRRRIFNREETIETSYNDHGDATSEVTQGTRPGDAHDESLYSEAVYSYQYDSHGNWTERTVSYRHKPDDPFKLTTRTLRSLTYY